MDRHADRAQVFVERCAIRTLLAFVAFALGFPKVTYFDSVFQQNLAVFLILT